MRQSGILLPISSLPSPYGIGCFSKCAYEFIDFLSKSKQSYWQILPLGQTSYGDSPYQSFSTFAGNPYFIDLEQLIDDGLLTKEECENSQYGDNEQYIEYRIIYSHRFSLLRNAFNKFDTNDKEYCEFIQNNAEWIEDYSLYMAVKKYFDDKSFTDWDDDIKLRKSDAIIKYSQLLKTDCEFYKFLQFMFLKQWTKLKFYANSKNIKIIGDIPIYVALDSSDAWANPNLFQFDEDGLPKKVAGCPPDGFTATGQLWGNPLYNWDYHKQTGYDWWVSRMKHSLKLYDMIRIDHFRGFDEYYAIPYGDPTAEFGKWEKGPGIDLFKVLKSRLGEMNIIAEDLGFLTDTVIEMLGESGYPGMKVLEFAFDASGNSTYLPHFYDKNSVVYTGTHDNETICGWYNSLKGNDLEFTNAYCDINDVKDVEWAFIRMAMLSVSDLCIVPIQDYLGLDNSARINTPSTIGDNWKWRVLKNQLTDDISEKIRKLTIISGR